MGLSRWLCDREFTCHVRGHRRCRFHPWVRKIPWRRKWYSSILARIIPWTEELGRLQPTGLQRVRHNWVTEHTHTLSPYRNVDFKWSKDLNVRPGTKQLLGENIDGLLFDVNHSNFFLNLSPKAKEIKAEINKWDTLKLKSFCTAKETINKTKRQPTELGENIYR